MYLEFTILKTIQIILCLIMVFAFGVKLDVSYRTREIASIVHVITLILVLAIAII